MTRTVDFGGIPIAFDDTVLHPREWTTAQSRWAASLLETSPPGAVLELCAGVGHIGLLAVVDAPDRELVLVDLNPSACAFARKNAAACSRSGRIEVREGRLQDVVGVDERYVGVIADPPWVPSADTGRFPEDPLIAIDGGDDGLDLAWACTEIADAHLVEGGWLLLQLGSPEQAASLEDRLAAGSVGLKVEETRTFERGVVTLLRRTPG